MSIEKATFGAGCFWGVEAAFQQINGVISTTVGYMGGTKKNPSYEDVCTGTTGHAEVVQILYDATKLSYEQLLNVFWSIHDPTLLNQQGPDIGTQYRSVIFFHDEEQRDAAASFKKKLAASGTYSEPLVTEIIPASAFYPAEDYHQHYYEKKDIKSCKTSAT